MELLYVWIEDYNNIHRQGFNFSPKHKFEFEPTAFDENNKVTGGTLTHDDINPDYPDNFFGENISNITAIVGKNGSGKSSLVKRLAEGVARSKVVFVCQNHNTFYCDSNISEVEKPINIIGSSAETIHGDVIYYSPFVNSNTNYIESLNFGDISSIFQISKALQATIKNQEICNASFSSFCMPILASYHAQEMELQIRFVNQIAGKKIIPFDLPSKVDISIPIIAEKDIKHPSPKSLIAKALKVSHIEKYREDHRKFDEILSYETKSRFEVLNDLVQKLYYAQKLTEEIDTLSEVLEEKGGRVINKIYKTTLSLQDIPLLGIFPEKVQDETTVTINDKKWVYDAGIKITWRDMSDGEISLLTLMSRLWDKLEQLGSKPSIIILDEFELGLHPQWQKESISKLISFFNLLSKKGHQIILTTHSPILLSDLPRENIIFLNTEKDGEGTPLCKVCNPEDMDRTFGANIHSLYRNSFFMQDGLMGEFAKGKIDGVIKDLNGDGYISEERKKEILYIIDMVGEPILKNGLGKIFQSKCLSEREILEQQKKEIERKLQELDKNDSNTSY